jgi:hypothetical protein
LQLKKKTKCKIEPVIRIITFFCLLLISIQHLYLEAVCLHGCDSFFSKPRKQYANYCVCRGLLKLPVREKQLSAASNAAVSIYQVIIHLGTVHVNCSLDCVRPGNFFLNCILLEKLVFNIIQ